MSERINKIVSRPDALTETARGSGSNAEFARRAGPIFRVVAKTATDLNDVLNAVALRSALLRGRPAGSRTDSDTWRLAGLLDRATELVRELQAYLHDVEAQETSGAENDNEKLRHN